MVLFLPGQPQRLGLTVSRKIGNAVARNRVRRVLREFFRLAPFCVAGAQIVVVARRGAPSLGLKAVGDELRPVYCRMAGLPPVSESRWQV